MSRTFSDKILFPMIRVALRTFSRQKQDNIVVSRLIKNGRMSDVDGIDDIVITVV